ncbi:MAG: tetratricopeptide repeat protein, partial [Nitrospirota bacterium]
DTLGWIYYKKGAYLRSISLLKEGTEKLESNPLVRYHLGMAYYKNGDKDQAKKELAASLKQSSNYPGADEAKKVLQELE